jgi:hypothetical protein
MRLKGDPVVNAAMDNAIDREAQFVRKGSAVVRAEAVHMAAMHKNCLGGEFPEFPDASWNKEKHKLTQKIKQTVKESVRAKAQESSIEHLDTLIMQGEFLKFALKEKQDPIWKGFMWNLKSGTAKFLINSTIHTLPTQNNLKLWNKAASDKCHLCGNREYTKHTLSSCQVALNQGRYLWRHNNIVNYIVKNMDQKHTVHSDMDGKMTPNGGTIPAALTVTALKPDITVLNAEKSSFEIMELSVPFEDCITSRHTYKANHYAHFCTDITTHTTTVTAFEVGARGFLTSDNMKRLKYIYNFTTKKMKQKTFLENCSALAIMGSFYIFTARKEPTWSNPGYLSPPL